MSQSLIEDYKRQCKMKKKFDNPENKTLMQIQHQFAKEKGFQKWNDLIKNLKD